MLSLALTLLTAAPDAGVVTTIVWDERSAVKLAPGQVAKLVLKKAPSRLAASDPLVCDVRADRDATLVLTAKQSGTSTVALWYGVAFRGLQIDVVKPAAPAAPTDAGVPFFTWDGEHGLAVPRDVEFVMQGPGGLEKVAPGSHRRCQMTSIGNDQLRFRCLEAGPVSVFLWYANNRQRVLELDVAK